MNNDDKINLFLDSGAFSAWSKGIEIDIQNYIKFIKANAEYLTVYSVLDSIGDPEKTLENQNIMEQAGLNPLPCFHYGEDISYFKRYIEKYEYIALGGMVPIPNKSLMPWLDSLFANYICDSSTGLPKVKIHGFGMTSLELMLRYPWYSVDSTSWVLTGRFGGVFVPRKIGGKYNYLENPWKVNVSNRSPKKEEEGQHFFSFSEMERTIILEYFEQYGMVIGRSEYREVPSKKGYTLKENERWYNAEDGNLLRATINSTGTFVPNGLLTAPAVVETIIESGLCNDYKKRDEMNIIYFLNLEKKMPPWPWPYKPKKKGGFGFGR